MNIQQFWERIYKTEECWLWTGHLNADGYACLWFDGKEIKGSRFMWELTYSAIPKGECVLHTCDVRACVNPEHLFLGTQLENIADMNAKGRHHYFKGFQGEANFRAKLTREDIYTIRSSNLKHRILANIYNVSRTHISAIKRGECWKQT